MNNTTYTPVWVNCDGQTGSAYSRDTREDALEYLKNRSKKLLKPDISQKIKVVTVKFEDVT